ncbi:MAG: queuosine precursor transporter [Anaerolineales bacterium]|nr:queuosine precursor transporter [Anaerolineales bacterium]
MTSRPSAGASRSAIWMVVLLVGGYIFAQVLADISATKIVSIFGYAVPAGTLVFALTFTLRDMIHKRLGLEWARVSILAAGGLNLVMALYLSFVAALPSPPFYQFQEEWAAIFAFVPRIVLASITAEVVSELIDGEVYSYWKRRFGGAPQWTRVAVSNGISLPIDSIIFVTLAFGGSLPLPDLLFLMWGQVVIKAIITVVSVPAIYLVREDRQVVFIESKAE